VIDGNLPDAAAATRSSSMLNQVFVGSGCLGGQDALQAADFRQPEKWWLEENYFHPESENTWLTMLDELVAAAAAGRLPLITEGLDVGRTQRRRRRDRMRLTSAGSALVRARHRLKKRMRRAVRERTGPLVQNS